MKFVFTLTISLLLSLTSFAQTGQVSGTSTPLATISLRKTTLGTQADETGQFTITNVPAGIYELVISAVGFRQASQPVTVNAGGTTSVSVELVSSPAYLEEVVVTASR